MVQLSHPYTTTGKTIALISVGKVMSLVFNTLSSFVTAFLAKMAVVIVTVVLEPKKIKSVTAFTFSLLLAMK